MDKILKLIQSVIRLFNDGCGVRITSDGTVIRSNQSIASTTSYQNTIAIIKQLRCD